jgi:hypothetical protein
VCASWSAPRRSAVVTEPPSVSSFFEPDDTAGWMMFYGARATTLNMCLVADRLLPIVERKLDLLFHHPISCSRSNLRLSETGIPMRA